MPEIIVKLGDRVVQKYLLYKDQRMSVGRAPDNEIAIENPAVSRRHATVQMVNGRYIIEDNNSANGTYVNGVRVTKTEILDKDVITIGKHKLHFYNQDVAAVQVAQPVMEEGTVAVGGSSPSASLRVSQGKQKDQVYPLNKVETRIGRAADNEIRLNDWFVSKHHAVIGHKGSVYILRDLDSWRHTMVNGEEIKEVALKNGDEIQFGPKITMKFELAEENGGKRKPVELAAAAPSVEVKEDAGQDSQATGHDAQTPVPQDSEAVSIEPADQGVSSSERAPISEPSPETSSNVIPIEEPQAEVPSSDAEAEEAEGGFEAGGGRKRRRRKKKRHEREAQSGHENDDGEESQEEAVPAPAAPVADSAPAAAQVEVAPTPPSVDLSQLSDEQRQEVAMWEKALQNPSAIIRKQAARKLKQLTGQDYDIS